MNWKMTPVQEKPPTSGSSWREAVCTHSSVDSEDTGVTFLSKNPQSHLYIKGETSSSLPPPPPPLSPSIPPSALPFSLPHLSFFPPLAIHPLHI